MDSFDDQNFGHILRDLGTTNETIEHHNSSVYNQGAEDENVDLSDFKIFTPLEIPKSKSQLNFCKSLTEKLKQDEPNEFSLTEIESNELVKNLYSDTKNESYLIPNSSSAISNETLLSIQPAKSIEDPGSQEILACLSDSHIQYKDNRPNHNNLEEGSSSPDNKLEKNSDLSRDETKITHPKFFQQKLKSTNPTPAIKRKADNAGVHHEPGKQRASKTEACSYYTGMIVWAKITGYSYWPAMIDNDPDVNAFTWPNDSSTATHYHVVFFDTNGRLSRSWVKLHYLKPFTEVVRISSSRPKDYIERFKCSVKEAKEAMNLSLEERLKKYSFKERLKLPGTKLCQD